MKHEKKALSTYRTLGLNCVFANHRIASRAITKIYDQAFASANISAGQVNALWAIYASQPLSQSDLGKIMYLDKTTLSRTLQPLLRGNWIRRAPDSADRRSNLLTVTRRGEDKLLEIFPRWDAAQRLIADSLGDSAISYYKKTSWRFRKLVMGGLSPA
jgi:DNA-binding MarR family transcriptional regulator